MVSYTLLLSLIEYKTLVLREDMEAAEQLLPTIPKVCFPFLPLQGGFICLPQPRQACAATACVANCIIHSN